MKNKKKYSRKQNLLRDDIGQFRQFFSHLKISRENFQMHKKGLKMVFFAKCVYLEKVNKNQVLYRWETKHHSLNIFFDRLKI